MNTQGAPAKKSSTLVVLVVLLVGGLSLLLCVGSVAAMVLPGFMKSPRAKQSEVKMNLKSFFTAERAYFTEKDEYSEEIEQVGFQPERGNRYLYLLKPGSDVLVPGGPVGAHGIVAVDPVKDPSAVTAAYVAAIPPALLAQAGVHGKCPDDCSLTVIAVGNIDGDVGLDIWSISTRDRTIAGESVPPGQPFMHVNDLDP